ncbi:MAG: type II toxin-antitoxin system death-on-curing family toxin [Candidatus Hydrogenedentes bacterium]|nr:type II toxin-antitoxin system death-on-curing family toxin [Candidatus Hydrogenedentota bacterium]
MREPVWITESVALAIHGRQISEHGGDAGLRDATLLRSALAKPRNLFEYAGETVDLAGLAGAYLYGIVRNHAFLDGNKRTALAVSEVFLRRNGKRFVPPASALYAMVMAAARGELAEEEITDFFRDHTQDANGD